MDFLSFLASVIQSIAWPLTILIIFLMLRRRIADLIPMLQRLRYKDIEIDFNQQVQELAKKARSQLPQIDRGVTARPAQDHMVELAQLSPRAVVLESWLLLEKAAAEAL